MNVMSMPQLPERRKGKWGWPVLFSYAKEYYQAYKVIRFCLTAMGRVTALALLAIALAPLYASPPQVRHTSNKTAVPAHNTKVRRTGARSGHSASSHGKTGRRTRAAHFAPAPSYQLHPDPERYQQIQQALADRGYFKGEANGAWSDDSVEAMRRFQADQKIDDDGKIDALSLIALGLGPKHDGATTVSALPPANSSVSLAGQAR